MQTDSMILKQRNFFITSLLILLTALLVFSEASAATITLAWNPNPPEDEVTGYAVYYGTASGKYTWTKDVGNVTTCTITGLTAGVTYYIVLTAYDKYGNESDFSDEVYGMGKVLPPVVTLQINSGAGSTLRRSVTLNNTATNSPTYCMASESPSFAGASWQAYSSAPKFTLSAGAGTKTVYFKTKNMDGESSVVTDTIALAPAVTSFKINSGVSGTAVQTVTLNNVATNNPTQYMASENSGFAGASWRTYSAAPKFTLSASAGPKMVYFKVIGGNVESVAVSASISALPPEVASFKLAAGALGTANGSVTLNNTAKNSPTHYMASESDTFAGAIWQKYSTAPSFALSSVSGQKKVYFKVKNYFAESSPASSDIIDALVPEVTSFKINAGALSTANGTVTLNNTVKNSPTHYMASEDSGFSGLSWHPYSTAPKFTLSAGAGPKAVYFKTKNIFGESSPANYTVDALLPEVTSFRINAGVLSTKNGMVTLNNTAKNSPTHYMASESDSFAGAIWQKYSTAPKFPLSDGGGEKTVYFKVKNSFGESLPPARSDKISAAGSAPVVTSFKINAGALSTGKETVTLNNTATNLPMYYMASEDSGFAGVSWQPYSTAPKFTLGLGSGPKTVYFKTMNIFGESSPVSSDTIDASVPEVTSFKINGGALGTGKDTVMLNNTAKYSPTHYMASESDTFVGAIWQLYSTAPKFTLSSGAGSKTVYFKTKNVFGESSPANYAIEALVPVVASFKINAGALSTKNGMVTLNNTAKYSPTEYMASELETFAGASWQKYSTAPKFALSDGDGPKTVYFKVKNSFAESAPWNDSISTAGSAPVVTSFKINAGALSTGKETVTLNNTATNLPMYYMASEDSGFAGASWQPYSTAPKFTLSLGSGPKTVYFKTMNIFGESSPVSGDTIDALVPEVTSFKINAGASSTRNGRVTLNNTTKNSPTHYMASELGTFAGADWQVYSTAPKFTLSEGGGTKRVYFKVKNSFGESSPAKSDEVLASGLPPVVTSFKINSGALSTTKETVTLNNTAVYSPMEYMASESPTFAGASWQPYSTVPKFTLSLGGGTKTVYIKLRNIFGESAVVSDTIGLIQ
jgi:hypothetical protein